AKAAKAAPTGPPPPKPDIPVVAAAKQRKKIPFWAMATIGLLPVWGFMYVQGVKPAEKHVSGPLAEGTTIYSASCSTCHGATGGGGVGRPFTEGHAATTFPHIEDQLNLVYVGTQGYIDANLASYGDPNVGHLTYNGAL
ncbi:MAG TPA: hypothetical protein PLV68_18935, partial [Ilumatobacteraceae bacterium]|nr:hypothetical protein [Ilumatobacteraceae bacterium]